METKTYWLPAHWASALIRDQPAHEKILDAEGLPTAARSEFPSIRCQAVLLRLEYTFPGADAPGGDPPLLGPLDGGGAYPLR
jgi:hypothetical protein